jgi:hypothetical protein
MKGKKGLGSGKRSRGREDSAGFPTEDDPEGGHEFDFEEADAEADGNTEALEALLDDGEDDVGKKCGKISWLTLARPAAALMLGFTIMSEFSSQPTGGKRAREADSVRDMRCGARF